MKSADPIRPSSRRGASGAWNRLKPVRDDTLEAYGLPSKGETRLNDFKTQETYYNRIVERYMKFCASTGNTSDLSDSFASLRLSPASTLRSESNTPASTPVSEVPPPLISAPSSSSVATTSSTITTSTARLTPGPTNNLPSILTALRKLREAITATGRKDIFAQRAYTFAIHCAILCSDWSSYLPAILHLLGAIHPTTPLSPTEHHEYLSYYILDLACRQSDLPTAYSVLIHHRKPHKDTHQPPYRDRRVEAILKSLTHDNYTLFFKMKRCVDGYQRRIMEYAEQGMRVHALKCLGRGYLGADRAFVERCTGREWKGLVEDGVGWELVPGADGAGGDRVVIRRPKAAVASR